MVGWKAGVRRLVGRWVGEPVVYIGVRRAEESHHRLHCSTLLYTALHCSTLGLHASLPKMYPTNLLERACCYSYWPS